MLLVYITDYLKSGENVLVVGAYDPNDGRAASGKNGSRGDYIFTSGIWQTVWLEPVEKQYISQIKLVPGKTLPAVYGAASPQQNAGDLRTKGYELVVSWKDQFDLKGKPFNYGVSFVLGDAVSEITRYDNPNKLLANHYEGKRFGEIWGYRIDGFFKTDEEAANWKIDQKLVNTQIQKAPGEWGHLRAGDLKFRDLNGDGEEENAIHLFASELEKNPITAEDAKNDDSIIYIGPGVYKADAIPVKSNSTIYLAGGAYVYGQIRTEGLENITIRGRGIISGSIYDRLSVSQYTIPIEIRSSKNIKIEDLTFLDPAGWTIALYKSKDVVLNNVKIISFFLFHFHFK